MSPTTSCAKIARRIRLPSRSVTVVRAGARIDPCDLAGDIHAMLARELSSSCWLHARDDLSEALDYAIARSDQPLLITTNARDWSPFELNRGWTNRSASLTFVVATETAPHIPSQLESLVGPSLLVRRNPAIEHSDELRPILLRTRALLAELLDDDIRGRRSFVLDVGLDSTRIDLSGAATHVAFEMVGMAERHDLLYELVAHLDRLYSRTDTRELHRVVRRFFQSLEG